MRKGKIPTSYKVFAIILAIALLMANMPDAIVASIFDSYSVKEMEEVDSFEESAGTNDAQINAEDTTFNKVSDVWSGLIVTEQEEGALADADSVNVTDVTDSTDASIVEKIKEIGQYSNGKFDIVVYNLELLAGKESVSVSGEVKVKAAIKNIEKADEYAVFSIAGNGDVKREAVGDGSSPLSYETAAIDKVCLVSYTEGSMTDENTGVSVSEKTQGALDDAASVVVADVTEDVDKDIVDAVVKESGLAADTAVVKTFDISITDGNKEIQPNGTVEVSVAIPEDANPDTLSCYYIGDGTETPQKVEGTVSDGIFTFERDHFCQFCFTYQGVSQGSDSTEGYANISWYTNDTESSKFYVSSGADLRGLALLLAGNVYYNKNTGVVDKEATGTSETIQNALQTAFTGKTIVLCCDVTMSELAFDGIGTAANPFAGTFEGNGHIIRKITIGGTEKYRGLFAYTSGATINNLGIESTKYTISDADDTESGAGIIAGSATNTVFKNCYVYSSSITASVSSGTHSYGIFAGISSGAEFNNCYAHKVTKTLTSSEAGSYTWNCFGSQTPTQLVNTFVDSEDNIITNYAGVQLATEAQFASTGTDGVASRINEVAGESIYKVSNSHPKFKSETEKTTGTLTVKLYHNGGVSTDAGFVFYKYLTGNAQEAAYSSTATSFTIQMVKGYNEGVRIKASAQEDFKFAGWYKATESGGLGEQISTNYETVVDGSTVEDRTIYAYFTGGPYSAGVCTYDASSGTLNAGGTAWFTDSDGTALTKSGTAEKLTMVSGARKSDIYVKASASSGKAFIGWYLSTSDLYEDPDTYERSIPLDLAVDLQQDTFLADDITDECAYSRKLTGNIILIAVFSDAVNVQVKYSDGCDSTMGEISVINGVDIISDENVLGKAVYVGKGGVYSISVKSKQGYRFDGLYSAVDNFSETSLITKEKNYTNDIAFDYGEDTLSIFARFVPADAPDISADGNIITINDEGQFLKKVVYQYSCSADDPIWGTNGTYKESSTDHAPGYAYTTWAKFVNNGLGKAEDGSAYKSDYYSHKNAYEWNGIEGHKLITSNINGTKIKAIYSGYYTLLCTPADTNQPMYTKTIYIGSDSDVKEPSVTRTGNKFTIHANGENILIAHYQLSTTDQSTTCPIDPAASWNGYVTNGQKVISDFDLKTVNGESGYITIGSDCDGEEIEVSQYGWYTFWIKYGADNANATIIQKRVLFTSGEDVEAEEVGDAVIKVLANTSYGTVSQLACKVRSINISGATNYGIKFGTTVVPMTGGFYGGYYYVNTETLTCGQTYAAQPVYYKGGTWTAYGNQKSITIADATTQVTTSRYGTYYGTEDNGVAYRRGDNSWLGGPSLDTRGVTTYNGNPYQVQTTFSNGGWSYGLEGSSSVGVTQSAKIVTGNSGKQYVKYTYILRNNSNATASGVAFGIFSDVQIGNNDSAPVTRTAFGITMEDNVSRNPTYQLSFALIGARGSEPDGLTNQTTTCSTAWFGRYGAASSSWRTETTTSYLSGIDSGAAMSWQNLNIPAGDAITINCIMGVVPTSILSVAPSVAPGVMKTGSSVEVLAIGNDTCINTIDKVYYQYSSSNVNATTCPYRFTPEQDGGETVKITADDLTAFKSNGINYRGVNGIAGYKSMSTPLYENDVYEGDTKIHAKNNSVTFTDAGWYTFLIEYSEKVAQVEEGTGNITGWNEPKKKVKVVNVKISDSDLSNVPSATRVDNTIAIFNNGAELTSVDYQLSDTDYSQDTTPYSYDTWYSYTQRGIGKKRSDEMVDGKYVYTTASDAATYVKVNGSGGTRNLSSGLTEPDSPLVGCRQIYLDTPGWYTVILTYKYNDKTYKAYKYIRFTQSDIEAGMPTVSKDGSKITVTNDRGSVSQVLYQLTTYDPTYTSNETAFMDRYAYGTGYVYVTTGVNEYRTSNSTSDFTIFSRIGQFKDAAAYKSYVAPTKDPDSGEITDEGNNTRDPLLVTTNSKYGYRSSNIKDGTATVEAKTPGWYTLRITYASVVTVTKYVLITEDDLNANGPTASINTSTGEVTVSANGHIIRNASINYATENYLSDTSYPANKINNETSKTNLAYYLTDANAYSWYGFYTYGKNNYTDINPAAGYYDITMSDTTNSATGRIAVSDAGWYNVYVTYDARPGTDVWGNSVTLYETKVIHLKLPSQVAGPEVAQYDATSENEVSGTDKRMMIKYKDAVSLEDYKITKYLIGYVGDAATYNSYVAQHGRIGTWYRMNDICTKVDAYIPDGGITGSASGRTFSTVVDKLGVYIVGVYDNYYGTRFYKVDVTAEGIDIREGSDPKVVQLSVSGNTIKGTSDGADVAFIKDVTSAVEDAENNITLDDARNAIAYTKGATLKQRFGNERTIMTIDKAGRVSIAKAQLNSIGVDKTELDRLLKEAKKNADAYTPLAADAYESVVAAGSYAIDTYYAPINVAPADGTSVYSTALAVYDDVNATTQQVVDAETALSAALDDFYRNSKIIEPDLVTVVGSTITVSLPEAYGSDIEYIIYSAADRYTISDGTRHIAENVWDSWAGISSDWYVRKDKPADNKLVLENVPDGVYTFQIKVNGVVYYRNPVVNTGSGTNVDIVKDYLGGTTGEEELIAEAAALVDSVTSRTQFEAGTRKPFVTDSLYVLLQDTLAAARTAWAKADITEKDIIQKTADLHNAIRRVNETKTVEIAAHEIEFTITNASLGQIKATNTSNNMTLLFVAKGEYSDWATFSKHSFAKETINTEGTPYTSEFEVKGNGVYTAYVKYADGDYEFKQFTLSGYDGYPLEVEGVGAELRISIPSGSSLTAADISKLDIAYGIKDTHNQSEYKTLAFAGTSITTPVMGMGEHTIFAVVNDIEYYIPAIPEGTPVINVQSINSEGAKVAAYTNETKVEWVAYVEGSYTSWSEMVFAENKTVKYIAQNENVTIPEWTTDPTAYTFFIKGKGSNNSYLITVNSVGVTVVNVNTTYTDIPSAPVAP